MASAAKHFSLAKINTLGVCDLYSPQPRLTVYNIYIYICVYVSECKTRHV